MGALSHLETLLRQGGATLPRARECACAPRTGRSGDARVQGGGWQRRPGGPLWPVGPRLAWREASFTWPTFPTKQLTGGRRCGRVLWVRRRMRRLQHLEQLGLLRPSHALEELLHLLLLRHSRLLVGLPLPASDFLHEPFIRQPQLDLPPARRRGLRLLSAQLLAQRCYLRLQLSQRLLVAARTLRALCAWRALRHVRRERLLKKGAQSGATGARAVCQHCAVRLAHSRPAPLRTLRGQGEGLVFGVGGWSSRMQCARRSRAA